ncbi:hypothetical protein BJ741DRAFT_607640 [Chytriomyces cf. hyalinus JEL632]|nr:hypothetical protein BJ741DRAFT_607640 [Chytriomyces cf. hyalinus JEL632]
MRRLWVSDAACDGSEPQFVENKGFESGDLVRIFGFDEFAVFLLVFACEVILIAFGKGIELHKLLMLRACFLSIFLKRLHSDRVYAWAAALLLFEEGRPKKEYLLVWVLVWVLVCSVQVPLLFFE